MKPAYFKLPFEVHYHDSIEITSFEFMSDINPEKFADIKIVRIQQGQSLNPSFICKNNSGPELYCCIINGHDQIQPEWLELLNEEDADFNYATNRKVSVTDNKISFEELIDEERDEESDTYLDVENMDYCDATGFMAYELEISEPEYIVLDAENSRLKVNLQGYVLDSDGNPTEERIFDPELLSESEELQSYSSLNMWEGTAAWVKSVLDDSFPHEKNLEFA
jgi:hypothetical protein